MRVETIWLGLLLLLGGCSPASSLLLSPGAISLSGKVEPFPVSFVSLVQDHLGLRRQLNLQVSYPRNMISNGVMDPQRWYVCVRQPKDRTEVVLVISSGKVKGEISGPAPYLCDGGQYQVLG